MFFIYFYIILSNNCFLALILITNIRKCLYLDNHNRILDTFSSKALFGLRRCSFVQMQDPLLFLKLEIFSQRVQG